jgi:hypothetical protein
MIAVPGHDASRRILCGSPYEPISATSTVTFNGAAAVGLRDKIPEFKVVVYWTSRRLGGLRDLQLFAK